VLQDPAAVQQLCARLIQLPSFAFELDVSADGPAQHGSSAAVGLLPSGAPRPQQLAVAGLPLCSEDGSAAYILLSRATPAAAWQATSQLLGQAGTTKVTFSLKQQLLALHHLRKQLAGAPSCQVPEPADHLVDVRIAAWLLVPDWQQAVGEDQRTHSGRPKPPTQVLKCMLGRWLGGSSGVQEALQRLLGGAAAGAAGCGAVQQAQRQQQQQHVEPCTRAARARRGFQVLQVGGWLCRWSAHAVRAGMLDGCLAGRTGSS
jgi:hypothetical protein